MNTPRNKIIVFLGITLALSSIFYYVIISAGTLESLPVMGLMWSPGIAAIVTQLVFHRSLRGLGWKPGRARYLLLGYLLPVASGLLAYGPLWLTGLGSFDATGLASQTASHVAPGVRSPALLMLIYLGVVLTWGTVQSIFSALGEEIGWRGLLVPELSKVTSFTTTALVSGGIWALWHYPLLLLADYHNAGAPLWFSLVCFTILVVGGAFVYVWVRLKSGSLWPAVLLHASHNLFIQNVFTPLTRSNALTPYFIDEFGILLPAATVLVALIIWRSVRAHPLGHTPEPSAAG